MVLYSSDIVCNDGCVVRMADHDEGNAVEPCSPPRNEESSFGRTKARGICHKAARPGRSLRRIRLSGRSDETRRGAGRKDLRPRSHGGLSQAGPRGALVEGQDAGTIPFFCCLSVRSGESKQKIGSSSTIPHRLHRKPSWLLRKPVLYVCTFRW